MAAEAEHPVIQLSLPFLICFDYFPSVRHQRYNIIIRDVNQPLLVSKAKEKNLRGGEEKLILLVPELCRATGITDRMRNDFNAMRAMAEYTRVGPQGRVKQLLAFNKRLSVTQKSMDFLKNWQLQLAEELVEVPGRQLPFEPIIFGNNAM